MAETDTMMDMTPAVQSVEVLATDQHRITAYWGRIKIEAFGGDITIHTLSLCRGYVGITKSDDSDVFVNGVRLRMDGNVIIVTEDCTVVGQYVFQAGVSHHVETHTLVKGKRSDPSPEDSRTPLAIDKDYVVPTGLFHRQPRWTTAYGVKSIDGLEPLVEDPVVSMDLPPGRRYVYRRMPALRQPHPSKGRAVNTYKATPQDRDKALEILTTTIEELERATEAVPHPFRKAALHGMKAYARTASQIGVWKTIMALRVWRLEHART